MATPVVDHITVEQIETQIAMLLARLHSRRKFLALIGYQDGEWDDDRQYATLSADLDAARARLADGWSPIPADELAEHDAFRARLAAEPTPKARRGYADLFPSDEYDDVLTSAF